jgi:hypothetical protein
MKIQLLTLFLIVSLTGSAWARLGENKEQLIARYGVLLGERQIVSSEGVSLNELAFKKSGFNVWVELLNGVSVNEHISNAHSDPMTGLDIKTLLDADAQGHIWKLTTPNKWQRDDGAIAVLDESYTFNVTSKVLIAADQAAHKAAHAHSLEGF